MKKLVEEGIKEVNPRNPCNQMLIQSVLGNEIDDEDIERKNHMLRKELGVSTSVTWSDMGNSLITKPIL